MNNWIQFLILLLYFSSVAKAWILVDDFEAYDNDAGKIPYKMNTESREAEQLLFEDTGGEVGNSAYFLYTGDFAVSWANTFVTIPLPSGASVGPGQVATLYWRAYEEGIDNNWMVGLSDRNEIKNWADNVVVMKVIETSQVSVYNGGYYGSDPAYHVGTGAWYHYWLVVNYDANTYSLWVRGPQDASPVQISIRRGSIRDFKFRRKPENALDHISVISNSESPGGSNAGEIWYIDDLHITTGEDLSIPEKSDVVQYERIAKDTITPIELNIGDEFYFKLHNGETRMLKLLDSGADILLTNVYPEVLRQERSDHGMFYQIWIDVEIDGEVMRMTHYLCSQFSFYEPYYVNGMRIWFEYNRSPIEFMTSNRGGYPEKEVRIVVNDMTDRIAPDTFTAWYRLSEEVEAKEFLNERIDACDCYKGDNMHMGGYFGATPHNGLDINMPKGTQMLAPIDFDDHFIVSRVSAL